MAVRSDVTRVVAEVELVGHARVYADWNSGREREGGEWWGEVASRGGAFECSDGEGAT